ncbi:MAG TPA: ABC transporter substrate-binding protein [Gaiellaceae bacterium]|nr:ABC transporter substrate-binding protein [Gaiellaceae bacterium]
MKKVVLGVLALAAALSVALPAALARSDSPTATPGVTSRSITIGGTFPFSGPVSSYAPLAKGMEAYFNYVNSRKGPDGKKGVYGRKIIFKQYDDGYNPANTVQLTNKLILEDKVFAIVGTLGTEPNLAIRPMLNQRKIPHANLLTGASYWGADYKKFPWTQGWVLDYVSEGTMLAKWVRANAARQKIAIFYQNDDYGKDYLRGFKNALGAAGRSRIVSERSYEVSDASYAPQIISQRASGADTWVLFTTAGTPTVRALATAAQLRWKPDQIVLNSVAATDGVMQAVAARTGQEYLNGIISTGYTKNVTNPKYAKDSAIRTYRRIMGKYGPDGINIRNQFYFTGVANGFDFVKLLYKAGKNLTRDSLRKAYAKMNWVNPYLLKGSKVKTGSRDHFPIDQAKITRYGNGSFSEEGKLLKGR